jgi:hypothetical protein
VPVVEIAVTPEVKSGEEYGIVPEAVAKSKKKTKKKSAIKSAEPEISMTTDTTIETQEVLQPPPVVEIKVAQNKQNEVKEEGKTSLMKWPTVVFSRIIIGLFLLPQDKIVTACKYIAEAV